MIKMPQQQQMDKCTTGLDPSLVSLITTLENIEKEAVKRQAGERGIQRSSKNVRTCVSSQNGDE